MYVIINNIKETQEGNNIIETKEGNEIQTNKSSVIITLPQEYSIQSNNSLVPNIPRVDIILRLMSYELNLKSYKKNTEVVEYNYNYEINFEKDPIGNSLIKILISGQKQEITQVISSLYLAYSNYESEINEKNQKYFKLAQNTLQKNIEQKKKLLDKYIAILNQEELQDLPMGGTIVNQITALSSEISILERTKELNAMVQLLKGYFKLLKNQREIIINKANIINIERYIESEEDPFEESIGEIEEELVEESVKEPVKSKKRQLLPVIISVFLAFFVGVFLAFIIEFFSREDVKRRLKKIKEK